MRKEPIPYASTAAPVTSGSRVRRMLQRWWMRLRRLMGDSKASRYTSLAPRHPDGSRTDVTSFKQQWQRKITVG